MYSIPKIGLTMHRGQMHDQITNYITERNALIVGNERDIEELDLMLQEFLASLWQEAEASSRMEAQDSYFDDGYDRGYSAGYNEGYEARGKEL